MGIVDVMQMDADLKDSKETKGKIKRFNGLSLENRVDKLEDQIETIWEDVLRIEEKLVRFGFMENEMNSSNGSKDING